MFTLTHKKYKTLDITDSPSSPSTANVVNLYLNTNNELRYKTTSDDKLILKGELE